MSEIKVLKFLGWLFIPYIMILVFWKKLSKTGRALGIAWAAISLLIMFTGNKTDEKNEAKQVTTVPQQQTQEEKAKTEADTQAKKDAGEKAEGEAKVDAQTKESTFSTLTIDNVNVKDGNVLVDGSTDLPNGASVLVDFDLANTEKYYGSSSSGTVKNGKYSASITPKQIKELDKGPYQITTQFLPIVEDQSNEILQKVGSKGEHLSGSLAKTNDLGYKELDALKVVDLNLQLNVPQSPSDGNYSWDHPVSKAYLLDCLNWINSLYQAADQKASAGDRSAWSIFLTQGNQQGWERYHKVNYQTNVGEDPDIRQARLDVATSWSLLTGVTQDLDSQVVNNKSANNLKDDTTQYKQMYQQALSEVQNLP